MKLATVQFVNVVNHHGSHLQGASNVAVGDRPGQPPYEIDIVEEGSMPCVRLRNNKPGATLIPMTNVASYRVLPVAESPAPASKGK